MASPKAPLLDVSGKKSDVMLEEAVFGAEVNWWYARRKDDEEIAGLA